MSPKNKKSAKTSASSGNNNTILIVVLAIVILVLLTVAALGWGMFIYQKKKIDPAAKVSQGVWNKPGSITSPAQTPSANLNQNISEQPAIPDPNEEAEGFLPPTASEKNMGFIKKVYVKNGKNYLDIDYLQWLTGTEAEKALREDGQCPRKGECIVYNDYYIRNQNTLIRTFEISPDADIRMNTLDSETTGRIDQNRKITFEKLQEIFTSPNYQQEYEYVPFIVEIGNNKIVKITEQYIP